ncbi:hypothetical protein NN561_001258 [Cricetulus griseus]
MAASRAPLHPEGSRSQKDYSSQNAARKAPFPIGRTGSLTTTPSMLQDSPLAPTPALPHVSLGDYNSQRAVLWICPRNLDCSSLASGAVFYLSALFPMLVA